MKLPSFKIQILIIFILLIVITGFITRSFFMQQLHDFTNEIHSLDLENKIQDLYSKHKNEIDKSEIKTILSAIKELALVSYLYEKDLTRISTLFIIFSLLVVFILFLFFLSMLTRPLERLQNVTKKIANGDLSVRVTESRFSPINPLIQQFNEMVTELEINRDKLVQAEKELMWKEMAQIMAHEIKNPLTPLRLSMQRLEKHSPTDNTKFMKIFNSAFDVINEEITNLTKLVQKFSDFAKMPSAIYKYYDIKKQITEIIQPYKLKNQIILKISDNMPNFYGDKLQMKQVFVNLVQNAIDSINSKNDGKILISASYETNKYIIVVEDNGHGIDKKDLKKIFRPYFTKKGKGTGLGLSIVKRIINQHKGTIEVKSKVGKGSKFIIIFEKDANNDKH